MRGKEFYHIPNKDEDCQATLFQQGEETALTYFFNEFYPALVFFAFRLLKDQQAAQDVVSNAFVKTWKMHTKLDSYAGIRAYLYKTVQRDCHHALNQEKRREKIHTMSASGYSQATPYEELVRAETHRLLQQAIATLSPGNQRVISMHFLDGMTNAEIARELNLHPHTVQTQKIRGIKALRKIIKHPISLILFVFVNIFLPRL
jgi:RNA polymerase sigma-70 factor (ECF subfamily)